jgi:hypothetical protein
MAQCNSTTYSKTGLSSSGHPTKPNSTAGVAFLLNKKFLDTDNYREHVLIPGRALFISIPWHQGETLTLLNIYAPNDAAERHKLWDDLWGKYCSISFNL